MFQIYHRNQPPVVFQAETTDLAKKYYVFNISMCVIRNFFSQTVYFLFDRWVEALLSAAVL